ncbi:DUF2971 domain-containing protein [Uliginosibacterium sp. 31-16]|uniref:DUF2971 domain-containing protein n=1 Tax=Uliginosibacterium sp. 31-16 TaxID=3068315 RepID=UPI00273DD3CC|nr:DUF2971 domain-containing protein [Uliginosibacterium sp. 31-16]MDP5240446.1 DUF2971 domain-containing protein [Uliginosibacterium sp. 31-16]
MNSLFFKYVTINTLEKILDGKSLKFTNPLDFNDPFDCNFPGYSLSKKQIEKSTKNAFKKLGVNISSIKNISNEINQLHAKIHNELEIHLSAVRDDWDKLISKYRVLCVTDKRDNILMWSHYAESHKGAVIGIDFSFLSDKKPDLVTYERYGDWFKRKIDLEIDKSIHSIVRSTFDGSSSNYTEDSFSENVMAAMAEYFYFKRNDWRYEREHRLVVQSGALSNDLYPIPHTSIKEVVFGVNTESETAKRIAITAKAINGSVKLYKAVKRHGEIGFNELLG